MRRLPFARGPLTVSLAPSIEGVGAQSIVPAGERRRRRVLPLLLTTALAGGWPALASAQSGAPSLHRAVDEYGVNLITAEFEVDEGLLSVGSGEGALLLKMHGDLTRVWLNFNGGAKLEMDGEGAWIAEAFFERNINTFTGAGTLAGSAMLWPGSEQGDGATLEMTSTHFNWTRPDGTIVRFDKSVASGASGHARPTEILYPSGRKIRIHYKLAGYDYRIQSVTSSDGYQLKFNYPDASSHLVSSVRAINNAVDYCDPVADACAGLTQTWPVATIARTVPNLEGPNVITVTKPSNETIRYTISTILRGGTSASLLTAIKEPGRSADNITFTYATLGFGLHSITKNGVTRVYDEVAPPGTWLAGVDPGVTRIDWVRDELNRFTHFSYDSRTRLTRITRPEGNYTALTYDTRGNTIETRQVAKAGSGLADIVTSASFPPTCPSILTCNKPLSTTDALGRVTDYAYDPGTGRLLTITSPAPTLGGVRPETRYTYSSRQAYYKNGSGSIVASGVPTAVLTAVSTCQTGASCAGTADEVKTSIDYGPQSAGTPNNLLPAASTVASGDSAVTATTGFGYDAMGDVTTVDGPMPGAGDTARTRYDSARRPVGKIGADPDGTGPLHHHATRITYGGDRVTALETGVLNSQSDADWAAFAPVDRLELSYDVNGRKSSERRVAAGVTHSLTQYSYDSRGRPECVAERMNPAAYSSLPASACTLGPAGTFGPDRITKTILDAASQVTQVRRGVGTAAEVAEASSTYTQNGLQASLTDAANNKTTFEYDGHDRPLKTLFPSPTTGAGTSSPSDYEQYSYDSNGNVTALRLRDGNSLTFTYDRLDRMTVKVVPERAGLAATHTRDVHYGYDLLGRQTFARFDSPSGEGITNVHDAFGRLTSSTSSMGGVARTFNSQYDAAGNRIVLSSPSDYYASFAFDALGRMSAYKEGATTVVRFDYDDLGRRSGLAFAAGATSTTSYGYDSIGRLNSLTRGLAGTAADDSRTFAYNPASQIITRTVSNDAYASNTAYNVNRPYSANGLNQYLTAGPASFTYDANGNLISDGSTSFVYDVENRLVSASGAKNATLVYDPLGRLWQTSGPAGVSRFVYDGDRLVEEYDGGWYRPRVYVHGPGADEPIVWYELAGGPVHRFYHSDHQGSIVALADDYGNSLGINAYDSWGIPNSGNVGRFGYTGQTWIPELGLWYYKARFYSPTLGRFMQTDPIGYGGGMNLYHYVGNDPVNSVDPSGLETVTITGIRPGTVKCNNQALGGTCLPDGILPGNDDPGFFVPMSEKGEGDKRKPPAARGCSPSGAAARARANAAASRFGSVTFNSKSEMALLTQYFRGDTTPYRLNAAEMAQARAYVSTYSKAVLGPPTKRSDGLVDRSIWFGLLPSEAPLLDALLGSATGVFNGDGDLVGIRDTFNFDFKDRGGYPYGWAATIGVALIRADAASCAGNVSIPVSGGTP